MFVNYECTAEECPRRLDCQRYTTVENTSQVPVSETKNCHGACACFIDNARHEDEEPLDKLLYRTL